MTRTLMLGITLTLVGCALEGSDGVYEEELGTVPFAEAWGTRYIRIEPPPGDTPVRIAIVALPSGAKWYVGAPADTRAVLVEQREQGALLPPAAWGAFAVTGVELVSEQTYRVRIETATSTSLGYTDVTLPKWGDMNGDGIVTTTDVSAVSATRWLSTRLERLRGDIVGPTGTAGADCMPDGGQADLRDFLAVREGSYGRGYNELCPPLPPRNINAQDGRYTSGIGTGWALPKFGPVPAGYDVFRSVDPDVRCQGEPIGATTTGSGTYWFYWDTTAVPGRAYYFSVRSVLGDRSTCSRAADVGFRRLSGATNIQASDGTFPDKIRITWDPAPGDVKHYKIFLVGGQLLGRVPASAPAVFDVLGPPPGANYYGVAAVAAAADVVGEQRATGDYLTDWGYLSTGPACGDGSCNGSETCSTCAQDCGACPPPPPACGDGSCNGSETCSICAQDCGACPPPPPSCGDGSCNGSETCSTCSRDCGTCPPVCGDGSCNGTETCSICSRDCGACPPPPPPDPPTNVQAWDGLYLQSQPEIRITWNGDHEDYQVFRCSTPETSSCLQVGWTTATSFSDTTMSYMAGIAYYYRVRGRKTSGGLVQQSPYSDYDTGWLYWLGPSGAWASNDLTDRIRVNWIVVPNAATYQVYQCADPSYDITCSPISGWISATTFDQTLTPQPPGSLTWPYYYKVKARKGAADGYAISDFSPRATGYLKTLPPDPPVSVQASDGTRVGSVYVTWQPAHPISSLLYLAYRCTSPTDTTSCMSFTPWTSSTAALDGTGTPGVVYYYRVVAKNPYLDFYTQRSGYSNPDSGYR